MHVASRNPNIVVSGDPCECPSVATGFTQARKERVSERIEHKSAEGLLIALLGLFCQGLEYLLVLPFETRRLNVAAASGSGPHPTLQRLPGGLPAGFQDVPDSRRHWEDPTRRCGFAVCNEECPV